MLNLSPLITASLVSFILIVLYWRVRAPQDDGVDSDEGLSMGGDLPNITGL